MVYPFHTEPIKAQRLAWDKADGKDVFGILMYPGTGKSKVALDDAGRAYLDKEIDLVLNLAPNGVHRNWEEQIETHLPPSIPRAVANYQSGSAKARKAIAAVMEQTDVLRFVNVNIEALSHESGIEFCKQLMRKNRVWINCDESQRIKTPSAKRTRNAWKLGREAVFRRILSGTPIAQGLEKIYAQFRFLDPAIIGCRTYTEFKEAYCRMWGQYNTIIGYKNEAELMARIEPWCFVATLEDCLDLPAATFIRREVELSPEQRRIYKELKDHFIAELASGQLIEAPMILARLTRLQQVLAGHVPGEVPGTWAPLPCPRLDAVVDDAEQFPDKFLVWCNWQADVEQICAKLTAAEIACFPYYGAISQKQCDTNLAAWRAYPGKAGLIGTARKGGIGLTMNEANCVINYSHSYSSEDRIQSLARNHRFGQDRPVSYRDYVAPGTVDTRILAAHRRNEEVSGLLRNPATFRAWLTEEGD